MNTKKLIAKMGLVRAIPFLVVNRTDVLSRRKKLRLTEKDLERMTGVAHGEKKVFPFKGREH